ncbi:hypothetical protein JL722_4168 [Aureococcus anophagefferens]|nr:hypothetical protein JL722_4168 [Aureococcus anophagefferens]
MADDQDPSCSPDSGSVNNNGDAQQVAPPTMDVIGVHQHPSSGRERVVDEIRRLGPEAEQVLAVDVRGRDVQAQDTQRVTADAKGTLRDLAFKIVKEKVFLVLVIVFMLGVDGGLAYLLVQNNGKFTSKR